MKKILMVLVGGSLLAGCTNDQVAKYRGDGVTFTAFNMSEKPIKYLDFN
ncbi:hypothetical protein NTH40_001410 [Vibrio harveyi]|nr:hypothetical protein [Vibrio harveyi]